MLRLIKKAIDNPKRVPGAASQVAHNTLLKPLCEKALCAKYGGPTNQLAADWDNLIILDACRYDTFAEMSDIDGELEYRMSPASATIEWLRTAVGDQTFYDTAYISANPRISRYEEQFHEVDHVWDWGWDDDLKVAPPKPVVAAIKTARNEYPDKRLVAHFMQPHTPYIGAFARNHIGISTGDVPGRDRALGEEGYGDWHHALNSLEEGAIAKETVEKAYRENLELVLADVGDLIADLDGKTVVTADHGELFGEWAWPYPRRLYDHPPNVPALRLRQVPWLVIDDDSRRETVSEPPQTLDEVDNEHVIERLQQLGYINAD